jgi:hypothetical protein
MTWAKFSTEFGDELARAALGDAAFRTHSEAIGWLYRLESTDLRIPKQLVRRFAGSPDYEVGIKELTAAGFWRDRGDAWEIVHHAAIIRQSIQQQRDYNERNRRAQRAHRKRKADERSKVSDDVSAYVSDAVSGNTYIHTNSFPRGGSTTSRRSSEGPGE